MKSPLTKIVPVGSRLNSLSSACAGPRRVVTALALAAAAVLSAGSIARAANTEYDVITGQTDLTSASTYTTTGTAGTGVGGTPAGAPPSVTSDVTFDSGVAYSPAAFTVGANLVVGSLNDLSSTALTIADTGGAAHTLTLGGAGDLGDSVPGSAAGDLFFVNTGSTLTLTGGTGTTALGLVLGQSGNFDVAGTSSIGSIISGAGFGITKTGAGTLTLSAVNTYNGGTTINAGTLQYTNIGTANGTNSGPFTLGGGTLQINQAANNFSYNPAITLTADSTLSNIGAGAINYAGTLNGGGFALNVNTGAARLFINTAAASVTNVSQFNVTAGALGFDTSAGKGGGAPVVVSNSASLFLFNGAGSNAATSASNNITLNGGTGLGGVGAIDRQTGGSTGTVTLSGTVTLNATSSIGVDGNTLAISGKVTGAGGLTKIGAGTLTLSNGTSDFSGGSTITAGTTIVGASSTGNIGAVASGPLGTGTITLNGGILSSNATSQTLNNAVTVAASTNTTLTTGGNNFLLNGPFTGSGTITVGQNFSGGQASVGIADSLSGFTGMLNYIGQNTDNLLIQSGTGINTVATFNLSGSTNQQGIILNPGVTDTIGGLSGTGGDMGATGTPTTLVINQSATTTYSGLLGGTFGSASRPNINVTKANSGTLSLTGTNLYTGVTSVTGGILSTGSTGILANGGTASSIGKSTNAAGNLVLDGGTLQYANTGAAESTDRLFTVGSTVAGATGTLDASGSNAVNFTNTGSIAYGTTGQPRTLALTGTSTAANTLAPLIADNGAGQVSVTKSGPGSWTLTNADSYTGSTTVSAGTLVVSGSLTGTTGVSVTGGTLQLAANNALNTAGRITLGGGTLQTLANQTQSNLSDLTVTSGSSTLTLGSTGSILNFADSSANTWTGTLAISNWNGSSTGGGSDQIFIGNSSHLLTPQQLADITFINGTVDGNPFTTDGAAQLSTGEIVAIATVPEPATWGMMLSGAGMLALLRRRRLARF